MDPSPHDPQRRPTWESDAAEAKAAELLAVARAASEVRQLERRGIRPMWLMVFRVIVVGLIAVLALGYMRMMRPGEMPAVIGSTVEQARGELRFRRIDVEVDRLDVMLPGAASAVPDSALRVCSTEPVSGTQLETAQTVTLRAAPSCAGRGSAPPTSSP